MKPLKIVLTTDFTSASWHAINYTIGLTDEWSHPKPEFVLVHGFKPWVPYNKVPSMPTLNEDELELKQKEKFEGLVTEIKKKVNLSAAYFKRGALPKVLSEIEESEVPDMVVMGTRQKDMLERMTIGTNTIEVTNRTSLPVLAVPEEAETKRISHVTFALKDPFDNPSDTELAFLKDWTFRNEAKLNVLHVAKGGSAENVKQQMNQSKVHDRLADVPHEHSVVNDDNAFDGISSFVHENNSDMLVASPQDRSFLDHIFHNSTTDKMAYHLKVPLLIL